ncbi:MoaB/Mog domain-containing protein [Thelephora terrestris]|uniref:MoaB/Mog domain-containing protein n=1 Tax=Thelephora terrestris TaxID=56493 RepID=A0A9P6H3F7_9AGAM|nr:MoaB/Mog domain-containing protein [Thelephora terrestris]
MVSAAVLTVSDTAFANHSLDNSGPTAADFLNGRGYQVLHTEIVPDDTQLIRQAIVAWVNDSPRPIDLIVTTGGTGFGTRDVTPEAVSPLIERHAPGLVHLILSSSLKHTPLASLSRPVVGTIGTTLVVTLPGSTKAVKENLEALSSDGVLDHALDLIKGGTGSGVHDPSSRQVWDTSRGDPQSNIHHCHHHRHHTHEHQAPKQRAVLSQDPLLPGEPINRPIVTARHRSSPYEIVSLEHAIASILHQVRPLPHTLEKVSPTLRGHVLAEDVFASSDVPFTSTTNVDGYALRSIDPPGVYKVLTTNLTKPLPQGAVFRVNTGGPVPPGADAVIMVEDTVVKSTHKDEKGGDLEEAEIETLVQIPRGENIRFPGSDVKAGDLVFSKHTILDGLGGDIGTMAFIGKKEVHVTRKPVVAILSTGNEIVDLHGAQKTSSDSWGGVWDTNRPSLQAALEGLGYRVVDLGIVHDNVQDHVAKIQEGLDTADLILTTGGTSMGPGDLLKPVIEHNLQGTIHFGRVKMKPGKPTAFATIPKMKDPQGGHTPIFALPGNPASALVTFYLFVLPALRRLGGWKPDSCQLPRIRVRVQDKMRLDPRPEFHRVVLRIGDDGTIEAHSTGGQRSSRVPSFTGANGLVALPAKTEEGPQEILPGSFASAVVIGEIRG